MRRKGECVIPNPFTVAESNYTTVGNSNLKRWAVRGWIKEKTPRFLVRFVSRFPLAETNCCVVCFDYVCSPHNLQPFGWRQPFPPVSAFTSTYFHDIGSKYESQPEWNSLCRSPESISQMRGCLLLPIASELYQQSSGGGSRFCVGQTWCL